MAVKKSDFSIDIKVNDNATASITNLGKTSKETDKLIKHLGVDLEKIGKALKNSDNLINENSKSLQSFKNETVNLNLALQTSDQTIRQTSGSFSELNTQANETVSVINNISSAIQGIESSINILKNFTLSIQELTQPENIKRLSSVLSILSYMARVRGMENVSDQLMKASDQTQVFADKMESIYSDMEYNLEELGRKSEIAVKAMQNSNLLLITGITYLGIRFRKEISSILPDGINARLNQFGDYLTNIFTKAKESLGRFMPFFADKFGFILSSIESANLKFSDLLKMNLSKGLSSVGKSFVGIAEGAAALNAPMVSLGVAFLNSDKASLKFLGTISLVAGIMLGGFATAIQIALSYVGSFIESIGTNMIAAMDKFVEKAQKSQLVMNQFLFVLKGFAREVGESAVGSVDQWTRSLTNLQDQSVYSMGELRKATKLIIAEGASLGLTFEDNLKILTRSMDIASAHGQNLDEVVVNLTKGFLGQSMSVAALGINLNESHMSHSKLAVEQGKLYEAMTETEKVQLRIAETFKQTNPLMGAAANELNTVIGANKKLQQSLEQVQVSLGQQSNFIVGYINLQRQLLDLYNSMPESIKYLVSLMWDAISVFLKITGVIVQYALLLSSLALGYKLLTWATTTCTTSQVALTFAMEVVGRSVGVQTIAVTSLSAAMTNLGLIIKGGLIAVFRTLGAALVGIAAKFLTVSKAILMNPLFIKATLIVGGIFALVQAFEELKKELSFFKEESNLANNEVSALSKVMNDFKITALETWKAIVSGAKMVIIGIISIGAFVKKLRLELMSLFDSENPQLQEEIETVDLALQELGQASMQAQKSFDGLFSNTAYAAGLAAKSIDDVDKKLKALRQQNIEKTISVIDPEAIKASVTGEDYEKLTANLKTAQNELQKLKDTYLLKGEEEGKVLDDIKRKQEEVIKLEAELGVSRTSFINEYRKAAKAANLENVKITKGVIDALQLEKSEALKEFDEKVKRFKKTFALQKEEIKNIQLSRKAIESSFDAKIAEEKLKYQEKELKLLDDIRNKNSDLAVEVSKYTSEENASILQQIKNENELLDKKLALIPATSQYRKELEQAINTQKDLNNQIGQMKMKDEIIKSFEKLVETNKEYQKQFQEQNLSQLEYAAYLRDETMKEIDLLELKLISVNALTDARRKELELARKAATGKFEKTTSEIGVSQMTMGDIGKSAKTAGQQIEQFLTVTLDGNNFGEMIKNKFSEISKSFSKITVGNIMDGISTAFNVGADVFMGVLNAKPLDFIASLLEAIEQLPESIMAILDRIDTVITKLIDKFPALFEKLMEKIPVIIDKLVAAFPKIIDMLMEALPKLVRVLMDAFAKIVDVLMDALPKILDGIFDSLIIIVDKIPAIIDNILDKLPEVLNKLFDRLPDLFQAIFRAIPKIIVSILDRLPDIVESLVGGIIGAVGEIVTAFVDEFLLKGGLERIIVGIIKAIPRIVVALVNGIVKGLQKFFSSLGSLFKGGGGFSMPAEITELPQKISEGAKKLGSSIAKETSQLFSVKNLEENAKNLDIAERINKVFGTNIITTTEAFKKAGNWFSEAIKKAWTWVKDQIWTPIMNTFSAIWNAINGVWIVLKTNIFDPIINAFMTLWNWVSTNIFQPIRSAFETLFTWVGNLMSGIVTAFTKLFTWVGQLFTTIVDAFKSLWSGIKTIFENVSSAFSKAFEGIKNVFSSITGAFDKIKGAFEGIKKPFESLTNAFEGIKKPFEELSKALGSFGGITGGSGGGGDFFSKLDPSSWSTGGLIPTLYAAQGTMVNFKPKGVDRVPAMLQTGEYVVKKSAVDRIGIDGMNSINNGVIPSAGTQSITIQKIEINARTNLDADSIRKEIIPEIEKQLLKKSQEGKRVIDPKGVRA